MMNYSITFEQFSKTANNELRLQFNFMYSADCKQLKCLFLCSQRFYCHNITDVMTSQTHWNCTNVTYVRIIHRCECIFNLDGQRECCVCKPKYSAISVLNFLDVQVLSFVSQIWNVKVATVSKYCFSFGSSLAVKLGPETIQRIQKCITIFS